MTEYFNVCKKNEKQSDKPYSGCYNVRLAVHLLGKIAASATKAGKS